MSQLGLLLQELAASMEDTQGLQREEGAVAKSNFATAPFRCVS
ncbi:hypothetical protein PORCRE_1309 [Porphyromonas crevioricanis JCM 15906]|uniref:Uncharacterized protein n=1 Tax=Porphyromonas crevioricanis JCM 15906 TaxID=1305617 RepID=T1DT46_9PORP|nr:hypothetical protein PORCRE_1309 [Porphyromonas crevioricanis JCM 15906]GAD06491.1 hypothetical protein PORCAN_87 [Porphyromonas crevioricanis JCM 13913]